MSTPNPFDQFDSGSAAPNPFDQFDNVQSGPIHTDYGNGTGNFAQNAVLGVGKLYTDALLGARQMYAQVTGGDPSTVTDPITGQTAAEKRANDASINSTWGGRIGGIAGAVPLAFVPGANTYAGAALTGGALGAVQPTVGKESRLLNAGVGGAAGVAGKAIGDSFSSWLARRASQPFMGWTPASADTALAQAVGSDAKNLSAPAIGERAAQLSDIFNQGRNAATSIDLAASPAALDQIATDINPSARALFENNPNVSDLMSHATGSGQVNGQMLGKISTGLRQDAYSALNSEGGNREVGLALNQLREHVENLIQSNIADPSLQAAYGAARPQYGLLQDVRYNPSVLNASTGRSNMEALGKYLQRNNPAYSAGTAEGPLFNAAAWGQAGGGAKGVPSLSLASPWALPLYGLTHNPVSRALGGITSGALGKFPAQAGQLAEGATLGLAPPGGYGLNALALPYLTE